MDNFDLKKYLTEGKLIEENLSEDELNETTPSTKISKSALKEMIKAAMLGEVKKLNEFGPMAGSGNRHGGSTRELVDRIGDLDSILMSDRKAEREWEEISQNYLDGQEGSEYWEDLNDQDLQNAIDDAEYLIKKYNIKESSVTEAKEDEEEDKTEETDTEEVDVEMDGEEEDMEMGDMELGDKGLTGDKKVIDDSLEAALEAARELGDEKLIDQIGNTITFFTRAHIVRPN